jgi:hypothetical protein
VASTYSSAVLFHGPLAEERALEFADGLGRLLHEPFGLEGLKIAESREIIELMNTTPIGDDPGVLIIGPMDHAWPSAVDVLLKTLEEFDGEILRPVLWAHDEAGVRPTIRSRCLRRWCAGPEIRDEELLASIKKLVDASLAGDRAVVLETLKGLKGDVLVGAAQVLRHRPMGPRERALWERVRATLKFFNPTPTEIKVAFL